MKNVWPLQSQADAFYGNPRGRDGKVSPAWKKANIIKIPVPFKITMRIDPPKARRKIDPVVYVVYTHIEIHKKCAESATRILNNTWTRVGKSQAMIDKLHLSDFSGSYNFRVISGGKRLSTHAYGAAWDWDADDNWLNDQTPFFTKDHPFAVAHAEEGWVWGDTWKRRDSMHWQAARVG